jgi:hypothetical protein
MPVGLSFGQQVTSTGDSPSEQQAYFDNLRRENPAVYAKIAYLDPKAGQPLDAPTPDTSAQQIAAAQASNPAPPAYSGPTAEAKLQALLPTGFENTLVPSGAYGPTATSITNKARGSAQDFIANMFRRGTLSSSGRDAGLAAITAQDPGVSTKLSGIGDTLLANERAKLRGFANEGFSAASGQSGETFDPSPYYNRANTEAAQFLAAFPSSYTTAVGDTGGLYDTSGLAAAGGGVRSPNNVSYDPYAVEGGKLSTGLDESGSPPPSKKRSTSVF